MRVYPPFTPPACRLRPIQLTLSFPFIFTTKSSSPTFYKEMEEDNWDKSLINSNLPLSSFSISMCLVTLFGKLGSKMNNNKTSMGNKTFKVGKTQFPIVRRPFLTGPQLPMYVNGILMKLVNAQQTMYKIFMMVALERQWVRYRQVGAARHIKKQN